MLVGAGLGLGDGGAGGGVRVGCGLGAAEVAAGGGGAEVGAAEDGAAEDDAWLAERAGNAPARTLCFLRVAAVLILTAFGVLLAGAAGCAVGWAVGWVDADVAMAVRENKVANPTAATALSCVARQVSRESLRSPSSRAAPAGSRCFMSQRHSR